MIKCSIPDDNIEIARENTYAAMQEAIEAGKPFDLKGYMNEVYTEMYDATINPDSKHPTAVDYARLVPQFVQQAMGNEPEAFMGLQKIGFDFNNLATVFANISNEETGLEETEKYLDLGRDVVTDIINANLNKKPSKEDPSVPPVTNKNAVVKKPFIRQAFDFIGQTLSSLNVIPYMQGGQAASTEDVRLGATPLYDALYENKLDPNDFYFKVKRKIVQMLPAVGYNTGEKKLKLGRTEVFLTAKSVKTLSKEELGSLDLSKDPDLNGVVLVLTDKYGYAFEFDAEGNQVDSGGQIAHYALRNTDKVFAGKEPSLTKQDEKRIKNLVNTAYSNLPKGRAENAARAQYIAQLKLIHEMRKYIHENKDTNMVLNTINGGTVGFAVKNEKVDRPLKSLDYEGQSFVPYVARATDEEAGEYNGTAYFKVDGFYGQPIEIQRPDVDNVSGSQNTMNKLISILVDVIQDVNGVSLSAARRQDLIDWYIETRPGGIQVVIDEATDSYTLMFRGTALNLGTPQEKEAAKITLKDYFTKFDAIREIDKGDVKGRDIMEEQDDYNARDSKGEPMYRNKVVKVTNDGITKYFVIEKPHLHVRATSTSGTNNYVQGNITDVELSTNDAGEVIFADQDPYAYSKFIFNNFTTRYVLEKNKLRKYNAYFTFQPTEESLEKIAPSVESEKIEKEVVENSKAETETPATPVSEIKKTRGPIDLSGHNFDKKLKDNNKDNELNKLSTQKAINIPATKKQLKAAEEWYNDPKNKELKDAAPLSVMFDMVNTKTPDSVATWAQAGITLFKGSDYSDIYHESWHAFSQLFLTKQQKIDLYNEVGRKSGSFTDYNGDRVTFKSATFKQIEEHLAEDFRKYMLNGNKAKKAEPVRNSLFQKILNFLKAAFANSTVTQIMADERSDKTVNEIYEKLRVGNLSEWTFAQENVMFGELNATMQATEADSAIKALNYENSKALVDTVDSYMSDWIDFRNSNLRKDDYLIVSQKKIELIAADDLGTQRKLRAEINAITDRAKTTYSNSAALFSDPTKLLEAYEWAQFRIGQLYNNTATKAAVETNSDTKDRLEKQAETLYWAYTNFGDLKSLKSNKFADGEVIKGVIGYHMLKSEKYFAQTYQTVLDHENMTETETWLKGKGSEYDQKANGTSLKQLAKPELIYLIRGLHKLDKNNQEVLNRLGAPELVEFQQVWNRLARVLQNTIDPMLVERKLNEEAEAYPVLKQLLDKLGPLATNNTAEAQLWTKFLSIFTLPRIPLIQMTLEKQKKQVDGKNVHNSTIGQTSNADTKVGRKWENEFKTNPDMNYTKRDEKGFYLDLPKIMEDFQKNPKAPAGKQLKGRERDFLWAIGWKIGDNPAIIKALLKNDMTWIYSQIAGLNARGILVRKFDDITNTVYPAENIEGRGWPILRTIKSGNYANVQAHHARYADEESNFMVTNAAGNTQFEHSLNNSMTIIVNTINSVDDYQDLISRPEMAQYNIDKNPYAASSSWLHSIFDLDKGSPDLYSRRKVSDAKDDFVKVEYTNLAGVLLTEQEGDSSTGIEAAKADPVTKMILDFHLATQMGQPELMRHADKKTAYSAYVKHIYNKNRQSISTKYIENTQFLTDAYQKDSYDLLIGHINAEFKRIKIMRSITEPENIDFNYWREGQNFVAFDDVLTGSQTEIYSLLNDVNDLEEYLNSKTPESNLLKAQIESELNSYFANRVTSATNKFNKHEFIADNLDKEFMKQANAMGIETKNNTPVRRKNALLKSYVYNTWINNIETVAFFYGDTALYNHEKEEFHKRNAGMGSTGNVYRTDEAMQGLINDENVIGRPFTKAQGGPINPFDGTFRTAIIQDNKIKSAYYDDYVRIYAKHYREVDKLSKKDATAKAEKVLKAYSENAMNEGDAQGWISFDAYRILKTTEGTWSGAQEDLYQKILNKEAISPGDIVEFFPVVKAQYFGTLQNKVQGLGYELPVTAMHKYSLLPLVPTMIADTNLEKLHKKMMAEGMDYTTFESGSKIGNITKTGTKTGEPIFDKFYTKGRKEISEEPFTPNVIFLNYLKNQLEIAPTFKKQVVFSTQLRKLVEDGLMENGVPTDFMPGKDVNTRITAWDEIIGDEAKMNESPRYKLVKTYENNIALLTKIKERELLDDIQWKKVTKTVNGEKVQVVEGKVEDLMEFVKRELTRQDMADHEIDFLQIRNGQIQDLSISLSADKIEKLLNALVVKRLIRQKVNGDGLIQVSGALFESLGSTDRDYTNATPEELEKWGTNDLPTYRQLYDAKGNPLSTTAMKIKIALAGDSLKLLNAKHLDGKRIETRERLNEMVKSEEWLNTDRNREMITMTAVRIPVQGLNSMEFMEVYEFLPEEAGNIIVPPAEIVAKSGSDFDIDKLNVMMPNLRMGRKGKFTSMFNYTEEEGKLAYKDYLKFRSRQLGRTDTGNLKSTELLNRMDEMLMNFFGTTKEQMDDEVVDIMVKEGKELSEAQFIDTLIGAKSVENDLIDNIKSILELPENFMNLTMPNSTDIFSNDEGTGIAQDLAEDVVDYNPLDVVNGETRKSRKGKDMISPTRIFEIEYNLHKHTTNSVGPATLGMGAVDNTYNTLFNRVGFHLNPTAGTSTKEYNRIAAKKENDRTYREKQLFKKYHRQRLFLPSHTIDVNGEKAISLSHDKDVNGEYRVADVINQMLNGWLDIAKDTWIFNIQGNKEVTPTLMFLLQAGVPVKSAVYFASMPMVRDYVLEQQMAKSTFAEALGKAPENPFWFRNKARQAILSNPKYGYGISENQLKQNTTELVNKLADTKLNEDALNEDGMLDQDQMRARIKAFGKEQGEYEYDDLDRAAFLHYLQAENMAMPVRDIKLRMNVDTSKSSTLFEAQNRILMIEALKEDQRIPVDMVEKLFKDTPIGSFYIQPLQVSIWKDLFPLRNHPALNKFLQEKFASGIMNDVKNTFGDAERFANEFRNDFTSLIFQSSLRSFNHRATSYNGYEVNQKAYELTAKLAKLDKDDAKRLPIEKALGKLLGIPVSDVTYLKQGISRALTKMEDGSYILDNELFVDRATLDKDFDDKRFATESYTDRGLAQVNSQAFTTRDEYYNFVYEREILRKTRSFSEVEKNALYQNRRNSVSEEAGNEPMIGETKTAYGDRLDQIAYEEFLRDQALTNTFNNWSLFRSDASFAKQFEIIRTAYPDLAKDFSIVNQLSIDTSGTFSNLKLNDTMLDGDMINMLHENILALQDTQVTKVDNKVDNQMISDFFKKMSIVAFLQSGMNTKSQFSLTRVVPEQVYLQMMEEPVKQYVKHLDKSDDSNLTPPILEEFYKHFVIQNSFQNRKMRIRGKQLNFTHSIEVGQPNYKRPYRLQDSINTLKENIENKGKRKDWIEANRLARQRKATDLETLTTPLVSVNEQGVLGYNRSSITPAVAIKMTDSNPDKVFVYNFAVESQAAAAGPDSAFFRSKATNTVGLPTLNYFSDTVNQLTDAKGDVISKSTQQTSEVESENISSKGSKFAKKLTNPGNNLKVTYKGKEFRNAEHAYQTYKSGEFDQKAYDSNAFKPVGSKPANRNTNYQTMVDILKAKLEQHPELIEGISQRGGLTYIEQSTHNVTGDKFWESKGQNKFIEALADAYRSAQPAKQTSEVKRLRQKEQAELLEAIPNAKKYLTDGKVDKEKITNPEDIAEFEKIYNKYDKVISPLLQPTQQASEVESITRNLVDLETRITEFEPEVQKLFGSPTIELYENAVGNYEFDLSAELDSKTRKSIEAKLRDVKKSFTISQPTQQTSEVVPIDQVTDVDGKITKKNKQAIDDAITQMKQAQADGKQLVFSKQGYGQYMIGDFKNKTNIAKDTFLYLSKRLFDEFNYINPKYLGTTAGVKQIQKDMYISDEMVRDFMKSCK